MNKNAQYVISQVNDLVTSVDPYASSKRDGDQLVTAILDLIAASRSLSAADAKSVNDAVLTSYKI